MPVNKQKLERAFARAKEAKGVSVPRGLEASFVKMLVKRQTMLWEKAVAAVVPVAFKDGYVGDASQAAILKTIQAIYRQYAKLPKLHKELREAYDRGDRMHQAAFLRSVKGALGISVADILKDVSTGNELRHRVSESFKLIKSLDAEMVKRLHQETLTALATANNAFDMKKFLLEKTTLPRYRAELIAQDQMAKFYTGLSQIRQTGIGVKEYIWRSVGDGRVRPEHAARDGKRFKWSDPPADGHPGEPVRCRCIPIPVFETAVLPKAA